jgi:GAF domain-containing protein/HAMP domain-containing protein
MKLNLSLQQRLTLAFIGFALLVFIASGTGYWFASSVEASVSAAQRGLSMVEQVNGLQMSWVSVMATVDNILITRQTGLVRNELDNQLNDFNQKLGSIISASTRKNADSPIRERENLQELQSLGSDMSLAVNQFASAVEDGDWIKALGIRLGELSSLQKQLDQQLNTANVNVKDNVNQTIAESAKIQYQTRLYLALLALTSFILGILLGLYTSRSITRPVNELKEVVDRVIQRDFSPFLPLTQKDEIGELSRAFALMTNWLRESYDTLEQRVADRTRELERRSIQIQVAAEVARDASHARELHIMLEDAVNLIRGRFGFYHAGIFLVDERGEYAILKAATGEAGRVMLDRGHKLKVGEEGIVGHVTATGQSRIALDVGEDAVHFHNPHLPDTHSEMALPLVIGDRVIGALDVQSQHTAAFSEEDITVLQIVADQLAIAIQNSNLLREVQDRLHELETIYTRYGRESWRKFTQENPVVGYRYDISGTSALKKSATQPDMSSGEEAPVSLPLTVRGEHIGTIEVWPKDKLSAEENNLLDSLASRISQAIESARLYQETRRRAERERIAAEISSKLRASNNMQTILQTAVSELQQTLQVDKVQVLVESNQEQDLDQYPMGNHLDEDQLE